MHVGLVQLKKLHTSKTQDLVLDFFLSLHSKARCSGQLSSIDDTLPNSQISVLADNGPKMLVNSGQV